MAAYTGVVGEFISDDKVRQLFEGALIVATENSRLLAGQIIFAIIYSGSLTHEVHPISLSNFT
jgi:hypothetical protein